MPLTAADLVWRLSDPASTAGHSTAQADPGASLGRFLSTTAVAATTNDLFTAVTADQNSPTVTSLYRAVFLRNTHATLTAYAVKLYLSTETDGGADVALGVDPVAASAIDSTSAQAGFVADQTTAPTGVTFAAPTTAATGVALGDLAPGFCRCVWVRLTPLGTGALAEDRVTIAADATTTA